MAAGDIGTRIKRARERKRWTQQQLADALEVDRKTVDNWENGRHSPRSSAGAIEEVLGMRLDAEPDEAARDPVTPDLATLIEETYPPRLAAAVIESVRATVRGGDLPDRRNPRRAAAS